MEYHNLYIVENSKYLNCFYLEKLWVGKQTQKEISPENINRIASNEIGF
jgi:hypothetical protein